MKSTEDIARAFDSCCFLLSQVKEDFDHDFPATLDMVKGKPEFEIKIFLELCQNDYMLSGNEILFLNFIDEVVDHDLDEASEKKFICDDNVWNLIVAVLGSDQMTEILKNAVEEHIVNVFPVAMESLAKVIPMFSRNTVNEFYGCWLPQWLDDYPQLYEKVLSGLRFRLEAFPITWLDLIAERWEKLKS